METLAAGGALHEILNQSRYRGHSGAYRHS